MSNNFCVISNGYLAIPYDVIKPNGIGVEYRIGSYLRLIKDPDEMVLKYPINHVGEIRYDELNTGVDVSGPVVLQIGSTHIVETAWRAVNSEFHKSFSSYTDLVYTRSAVFEMEVALKAASLLTNDALRIASIAAKAANVPLSRVGLIDIESLQKGLSAFKHLGTASNIHAFKQIKEMNVLEKFEFMSCIIEKIVEVFEPCADLKSKPVRSSPGKLIFT